MYHEDANTIRSACPVCGSADLAPVAEIRSVPVYCNVLLSSRSEALHVPRGDISLMVCRVCGHIFNAAFDPRQMEYTQSYENSLHFSPRFQGYAQELAEGLVARYQIQNRTVIDIGCGKGDFLALLCGLGNNRGFGFDPSYVPGQLPPALEERMTIIQDYYSPRYAQYQADLIVCRHVLEHIRDPRLFLKAVREAIGARTETIVFFEVPNVLYTLADMGIWDVLYEHCSYFSVPSLSRAFRESGFSVLRASPLYDNQFLGVDARPDGGPDSGRTPEEDPREVLAHARVFADKYREKVQRWTARLEKLRSTGARVAVWGGGTKGVMFLNTMQTGDGIPWMVDINPRKLGKFVPGTGQQIVAPEFLVEYRPNVIIIMNPTYRTEIEKALRDLRIEAAVEIA